MKYDSVSRIASKDTLIKEFGSMLIEKQGGKDHQFISPKMRACPFGKKFNAG